MNEQKDIVFVNMPWARPIAPSLQLGCLQAMCDKENLSAVSMHLNIAFIQFLNNNAAWKICDVSLADFYAGSHVAYEIDLVFLVSPFIIPGSEREKNILDHIENLSDTNEFILRRKNLIKTMRALVPEFLLESAKNIVCLNPRIVGFTCTLNQLLPSLVLAKVIKNLDPSIRIIFGGTGVDSNKGPTVIQTYDWIDIIVRGEAEGIVPNLFREILSNDIHKFSSIPGLCFRTKDGIQINDENINNRPDITSISIPNCHDYYERIANDNYFLLRESSEHPIKREIWLEASRGCWWGETSNKCTFCGRRSCDLIFRSKTSTQIQNEITYFIKNHQVTNICFADPCIDPTFLYQALLPLKKSGMNASYWVEGRVLTSKKILSNLKDVGVTIYFAGIEQLSTKILALMKKGITGLQAIRFLKWASEIGISITWNILYGFPDEPATEYRKLAQLIPNLTHLEAPIGFIQLQLNESSEYYENPEKYGITLLAPSCIDIDIYGTSRVKELIGGSCYKFARTQSDTYIDSCRQAIATWQTANRKYLLFIKQGDCAEIHDSRFSDEVKIYRLNKLETAIYSACDNGANLEAIIKIIANQFNENDLSPRMIASTLLRYKCDGLIYEENGEYLSLAINK